MVAFVGVYIFSDRLYCLEKLNGFFKTLVLFYPSKTISMISTLIYQYSTLVLFFGFSRLMEFPVPQPKTGNSAKEHTMVNTEPSGVPPQKTFKSEYNSKRIS